MNSSANRELHPGVGRLHRLARVWSLIWLWQAQSCTILHPTSPLPRSQGEKAAVFLVSRGHVRMWTLPLTRPHRISVWSLSYFPSPFHPSGKHVKGLGMNGGNPLWKVCKVEREEDGALIGSGLTFIVQPNLPSDRPLFALFRAT